ncbi:hypothetical protein C0J52_16209 [Blattella germanica]|nr:hypothetical protein C0J52_16209 [Blattella germanica]
MNHMSIVNKSHDMEFSSSSSSSSDSSSSEEDFMVLAALPTPRVFREPIDPIEQYNDTEFQFRYRLPYYKKMIVDDPEAFKSWLTTILEPLCDADPAALAKYIFALVKKDKPVPELRNSIAFSHCIL